MDIGRENENIEFKKTTSETKEGIISISSILNKHGFGTLYFGVRDDGVVIGSQIGKDTLRKVSRSIQENIRPVPYYTVDARQTPDGLSFIEVQFSGNNAPYSAYGKYYQRYSDEDKQMTDTELERLFKMRQKDHSAWEEADSDATLEDIDIDTLKNIITRGTASKRIRYAFSDATTVATKLGLYNAKSGKLSNAGKVLLSKKKPVLLKTACFASKTRETFLKLNHFEGNVFTCIDEAISFIYSCITWAVSMNGNAQREEVPEIPAKAIREIVVNAFAHGSYEENTAFSVEVFSDRVEIYSPGRFPEGYTPEDFANSKAQPIMLNPKIVNVLFKADEIESFGYGFENTFKACAETKTHYSYENTLTGFRFILYRATASYTDNRMSKTEESVLNLLRDCDYLTNAQIASKIGKSEKTVYRAIKALKEKGYLERKGTDREGYWEILAH